MEFGSVDDVRLLSKIYSNTDFDDRLFEIAKDNVWNSIKFALLTNRTSVRVHISKEYLDNIIAILKGYGYVVTKEGAFITIDWSENNGIR